MLSDGTTAADSPDGLVILGAGLAGLGASLETRAPCYEAGPSAGGVALSDTTDGFIFDRGIHILQTRNEEILRLFAELGVPFVSRERNAHIYSHGTYTAYPFQVNTAGLPIGLRARCVWNFLRRGDHPPPANYEEWIYAAMGRGFGDTFLIPYSEKFWTVHPREMGCDWMGGRVPEASMSQVIRGALWNKQTAIGTNVTFRYPRFGYGQIAEALAERVGEIHVNHRATRIDTTKRRIEFNAGAQTVDYRLLISSIPLPELIRIASEAPSEVRRAAEVLRTNSICVVNLGIDRPRISDKHWVHFPEEEMSFFRISFPHNLSDDVTPPGKSSISAEVAYAPSAPIDREAIVDRVVADLIRAGAMRSDDRILVTATHDIRWGYCIYDLQRAEALRAIFGWLESVDIIPTGRYGLWRYFWSDETIVSGFEAAEQARERLAAPVARQPDSAA